MSSFIAESATSLLRDPHARARFLNADNSAKAAGTLLTSPALASTFATIANGGIAALYGGALARTSSMRFRTPPVASPPA